MRQSLPFIRCHDQALRVVRAIKPNGQPLGLYLANNFYLTKQAEEAIRNAETQEVAAAVLLKHYGPRYRS